MNATERNPWHDAEWAARRDAQLADELRPPPPSSSHPVNPFDRYEAGDEQ